MKQAIAKHIEHVKSQPHHVRHQVTIGAAGLVTAVIALVWVAGSVTAGSFAIHASSFAAATGADSSTTTTSAFAGTTGLAGAAAAIAPVNAPAHIEIVDTTPKPTAEPKPTVIPF